LGNFSDAIHTNLDLLTLSNLPPGSRMMWLHLASVYLITFLALKVGHLEKQYCFRASLFCTLCKRVSDVSSL
jgi:hypothetical protein